jgi:uncharacterized protein (DUF779 family)
MGSPNRSHLDSRRSAMKAAVVRDFTKTLTLEDVPKPKPGPGEVIVKVETAGLCHTDIHAAHGDWPVKPTPPFIPGHEGVGIVEQVGPGVITPQVGDRVAMPWLGEACGVCDYCVDGWETLCEKQVNTGYGVDGCPFYIDRRLDEAWHQDQFVLDVAAGDPEDFSLPAGADLHFVTRSPACTTASDRSGH